MTRKVPSQPDRGVVLYRPGERCYARSHERATHLAIAHRLAALKGFASVEEFDPARRYDDPVYVLPSDTLIGLEAASALGIRGEHDLFGGVVPHAFVATKAITHPLVEPDAVAPAGWSIDMGRRVENVVLPGFTAFTPEDARLAGRRLLDRGPVRVKPVRETGGRGQAVARDDAELTAVLDAVDPTELSQCGLVLEEDLGDVTTFSVGQVRVGDLVATYYGTQRLTADNGGKAVYGGSDLTVWRGGFDTVLGLELPEPARLAVMQACAYDEAATACFPGFFASRRNYDVVQGLDSRGRRRSGVLEQSWRIGGASGAEIAALEAFRRDPALPAVRATCVEAYGEDATPPPEATVDFRGTDERVGFITKYTLVERVDAG
ncbi:DUF3182 family protein [Azospirillum soli]|uniref:DUF3182 family protein n=1 Tax=Azospirillum soli TaxID=1304799 RepID=UPI001AE6DF61|nr:DUF3182 family protein [Azospirillum soli]MBP2315584.1 hypothetical protein [Azospirillum soli]